MGRSGTRVSYQENYLIKMLLNPHVGQRVRRIKGNRAFRNKTGRIAEIHGGGTARVYFDDLIHDYHDWNCMIEDLEPEVLSPQDIEHKQREEHTDRYS